MILKFPEVWNCEMNVWALFVVAGDGSKKIRGCWDSIHVVEVQERGGGRNAHYKLTSTAMLWLQVNKQYCLGPFKTQHAKNNDYFRDECNFQPRKH